MLNICELSVVKKKASILSSVSLVIPKKRVTLLLGKSGSGKTTLLRCIAQLEKEYLGEVTCEGRQLLSLEPKERSSTIGFIPQSFSLFPHMTVLDNCAYAVRHHSFCSTKEAYGQVQEFLKLFDMEKLALSRPDELSGGQKQRVAIIRALLLNPSFLLFDEPTSALDPENRELFSGLLEKLLESERGIVIATHDMVLARRLADLVYFLEEGVVLEHYDAQKTSLDPTSRIARFFHG